MINKIFSKFRLTFNKNIIYNNEENKIFGFWIYLMSDCILFATLFATYSVLSNEIANGPNGKDIFNLPLVLLETFFLLFSSFTFSLSVFSFNNFNIKWVKIWLCFTFFLGLSFIFTECYEFFNLINKNFGPQRSAFLSAFFTLLGAHGIHVIAGLIWIIIMIIHIYISGLTKRNKIKLKCLSLFWHFLDIIWICIFTVVYLFGVIK